MTVLSATQSGPERVGLGSRVHGIECCVLRFLDRGLGEVDGVERVVLRQRAVRPL
jgi:hypothetical protein